MRALRAVVVSALALAAACTRGETGAPGSGPSGTTEPSPPACAPVVAPPQGFRPATPPSIRVPGRLTFHGPGGASITYLVGITGEVGEGLPLVGTLRVAGGPRARFLGARSTWAIVWRAPAPCRQNAVVGNAITRARFLRALRSASVIAA